jgi:hypothetical protein
MLQPNASISGYFTLQFKKLILRVNESLFKKNRVSYLHRTAQPPTLASFQTWGSSAGAGRTRLTPHKCIKKWEMNNKIIKAFVLSIRLYLITSPHDTNFSIFARIWNVAGARFIAC